MKLKMSKQYETSSLILFSCLLFQNSSSWCRKRVNERSSHELIVWALYLLEMQQVKRFNYAIDVNLVNFFLTILIMLSVDKYNTTQYSTAAIHKLTAIW